MKHVATLLLSALLAQHGNTAKPSVDSAATRYAPGFKWQAGSVVGGDFSCRGRKEQAILGTNSEEIAIAIFLNGTNARPQILRYSAKARKIALAHLKIEVLNYNPVEAIGEALPGFRQSTTCVGLNLSDGMSDSAHIYWNRDAKRFEEWSL